MQHPDLELVMLIIAAFIGIANLLVFCYFGKLTTESSLDMADCVYNLNWHQFDNDLKKNLIPIIQMGQRPLIYEGYGIFTLNLETFTQVIICKFETMDISKIRSYADDDNDDNHEFSFHFFLQLIKTIFSYYMFLKTF